MSPMKTSSHLASWPCLARTGPEDSAIFGLPTAPTAPPFAPGSVLGDSVLGRAPMTAWQVEGRSRQHPWCGCGAGSLTLIFKNAETDNG